MNRRDRRSVTRASILLDLVHRNALADREKAAAILYEKDREKAEAGRNPRTSNTDALIVNPSRDDIGERMEATARLEQIKGSLPPSIRLMLGQVERTNTTRRGSLAGLPIRTGMAAEREHALVCVGALKTMLACLADAYRLPGDQEAA